MTDSQPEIHDNPATDVAGTGTEQASEHPVSSPRRSHSYLSRVVLRTLTPKQRDEVRTILRKVSQARR